jgi:hypothetical protein
MSISTKTNSYGGIQALIDVEIVDQGIRPGVAPTLEGKARKDIIEIEKFTTDLRKCAINGVFPDGFRLTA